MNAVAPLTNEEIMEVWYAMPGGPEGWLKQFGCLQFARAIEERLGVDRSALTAADRIVALEAKCALLSASLKQADTVCDELTAIVAALGPAKVPA